MFSSKLVQVPRTVKQVKVNGIITKPAPMKNKKNLLSSPHRDQETSMYYCTTNELEWLLYRVLESKISPVDDRIKSTCRWVRFNTRKVL